MSFAHNTVYRISGEQRNIQGRCYGNRCQENGNRQIEPVASHIAEYLFQDFCLFRIHLLTHERSLLPLLQPSFLLLSQTGNSKSPDILHSF